MNGPYDPNKFSLGGDKIVRDLSTDLKMQQSSNRKKTQQEDAYVTLGREQLQFMKDQAKEQKQMGQQQAMTQGLMGSMQSGIQTGYGAQTPEQAMGGALMTGLQAGVATMNPYVGAAAFAATLFMGNRSAKKAERQRKKAEAEQKKQRKLQNMREALSGYNTSRANAMNNLMTVLSS